MSGIRWGRAPKECSDKVIIVGSGTSLTNFNFAELENIGATIITVNGAGDHVPFADYWFTLDPWGLSNGTQLPKKASSSLYAAVPEDFGTHKSITPQHRVPPRANITYLHRIPFHTIPNQSQDDVLEWGMNEDTSCINTGNSGFGALNFAYHMRPRLILLLGIDGGKGYFYKSSKQNKNLAHLPNLFRSAVPQLASRSIAVLNGSPISTLRCFPRYTIPAALAEFKRR